jgi:hypothetical protein
LVTLARVSFDPPSISWYGFSSQVFISKTAVACVVTVRALESRRHHFGE